MPAMLRLGDSISSDSSNAPNLGPTMGATYLGGMGAAMYVCSMRLLCPIAGLAVR